MAGSAQAASTGREGESAQWVGPRGSVPLISLIYLQSAHCLRQASADMAGQQSSTTITDQQRKLVARTLLTCR
jgi:hypothetical protein